MNKRFTESFGKQSQKSDLPIALKKIIAHASLLGKRKNFQ
jgi:hypothetical protein